MSANDTMEQDAATTSAWEPQRDDERQEVASIRRADASLAIQSAVAAYESRFNLRFDTLSFFPKTLLTQFHQVSCNSPSATPFTIASERDTRILDHMKRLADVANSSVATRTQRLDYYEHLLSAYRLLPNKPASLVASASTLCVGIRREGAILADELGWLSPGRSLLPDAKRIPFKGGLIVGLQGLRFPGQFKECVITDGAIASGATLMATIHALTQWVSSFHVFSVHSTVQGIAALCRFARSAGLQLTITVGHATDGLNSKYYATLPGEGERLAVGDLGDTISDFAKLG